MTQYLKKTAYISRIYYAKLETKTPPKVGPPVWRYFIIYSEICYLTIK